MPSPRGRLARASALAPVLLSLTLLAAACGTKDEPVEEDGGPKDVVSDVRDAQVEDVGGIAPCTGPADCTGDTPQCDLTAGACVGCLLDQHCAEGEVCLGRKCTKPTECTSDKQCLDLDAVCGEGACVDCLADGDCADGYVCRHNHCLAKPKSCSSSKECAEVGGVCDKAKGYCVDCTSDPDCAATDFCAEGLCLKDICAPGDSLCVDPAKVKTCDANGGAWTEAACKDSEACDDGACKIVICKPGDKLCAKNTVKTCNARGTGVGEDAPCKDSESCKDGACLPKVCKPGETKCGSGAVETCNADGLGWTGTPCKADQSCAQATGADAKCEDHLCTPKSDTCDGDKLAVCADDGLSKTAGQSCATLQSGKAGTCVAGACVPKGCKDGDTTCAQLSVLTCDKGAWKPVACPAKQTCSAGKCVPVSCIPNETYCDLGVLKKCNGAGDDAAWLEDCAASGTKAAPKGCKGGKCVPLACVPGQSTCDKEGKKVQTCKADGFGTVDVPCGSAQVCLQGACKKLICEPNKAFCDKADVYECDATGTAAKKKATCGKGKGCKGGACIDLLCSPGVTQCGSGKDAAKLQTCAKDGLSWITSSCPSGNACLQGVCTKVVCEPNKSFCSGADVMVCNATGTKASKAVTCGKGKGCLAGACKDLLCSPGVTQCATGANAGKLQTCAKDGLSWITAGCPSGHSCAGSSCKKVVCAPGKDFCSGNDVMACDPTGTTPSKKATCAKGKLCQGGKCLDLACKKGDQKCGTGKDAGKLLKCKADQLGWFVSACAPGSTCNADKCMYVICEPNKTACQGDKLSTCNATGTVWTTKADCAALKQVCVGAKCVSPSCKPGETACKGSGFAVCNKTGTGWDDFPCNDNNACTQDSCKDGTCVWGKPPSCDDSNSCTTDYCNQQTGKCVNSPISGSCDDGTACTTGDNCQGGKCVAGKGTVETWAGISSKGYQDGPGSSARFYYPNGVATDDKGGVYVADRYNNRIRYIDASQNVTTLAGQSSYGSNNGPAKSARFRRPHGVAWDALSGAVYVADTENHRIRKILNGQVTTLVGASGGYQEGSGTTARFNYPRDVAVLPDGRVVVSDYNNQVIRVITGNTSSLLAGKPKSAGKNDGPTTSARFTNPWGIGVAPDGAVYVAGYGSHRIRKIQGGQVTTVAGTSGGSTDGPKNIARFNGPTDVAWSAAGLLVADANNHRLRWIDGAGTVSTLAGSTSGMVDGPATSARFTYPRSVAFDNAGRIFVADRSNARIRRLLPGTKICNDGKPCTADACDPKTAACSYTPIGVGKACDDGTACTTGEVCDKAGTCGGGKVKSCSDGKPCTKDVCDPTTAVCSNPQHDGACSDGNACTAGDACKAGVCTGGLGVIETLFGGSNGHVDGPAKVAKMARPWSVAADDKGGVWISTESHRVRYMNSQGQVSTVAGTGQAGFVDGPGGSARFNVPRGVVAGRKGLAFVADTNNHRVRRISPAGVVSTFAGTGTAGYVDGPGGTAQMKYPWGIGITIKGLVVVADSGNYRLRAINPAGQVSTLAGSGSKGYLDGPGSSAQFGDLRGLDIDVKGNVFVVDYAYRRIRKVATNGAVTTVAGSGSSGYQDGAGSSATFGYPTDVALSPDGRLFIADDYRVRVLDKGAVTTLINSTTSGTGQDVDGGLHVAKVTSRAWGLDVAPNGELFVGSHYGYALRRLRLGKVTCDDHSVCTNDSCNAAKGGCQYAPLTVGVSCGDGDACTFSGKCDAKGQCVGKAKSCDDGNVCTTDSCDPYLGQCANEANRLPCNDGSVCTVGEECFNKSCSAELPKLETLAGSGSSSSTDGKGSAASFYAPYAGLWVGDKLWVGQADGRIREVTLDGTVTTPYNQPKGHQDGPKAVARFYEVMDMVYAKDGSVLVATGSGNRIRRIDQQGTVTTFAGDGSASYYDGPKAAARFKYTSGLAVDVAGNVYVSDMQNYRIRKIDLTGQVSTLAGSGSNGFVDGPGSSARFYNPRGIDVDLKGNVFVADHSNHRIRRIDPTGQVSTVAGNGANSYSDGPSTSSALSAPWDVVVRPGGALWVTSYGRQRMVEIVGGKTTALFGDGVATSKDGFGTKAQLHSPANIAVHPAGHIAILDVSGRKVRLVRSGKKHCDDGKLCTADSCDPKSGGCVFKPLAVGSKCEDNNACTTNTKCDAKGQCSGTVNTCNDNNVCTDDFCDTLTGKCANPPNLKPCSDGTACTKGETCAEGKCQTGLGLVTTYAGSSAGYVDGKALEAKFKDPSDMAMDKSGTLYVADHGNHRIRKITADGATTTLAGSGNAGYLDGAGSSAQFYYPTGLSLDGKGGLVVADSHNHRLRTINATGAVGTLAGSGGAGYQDGFASSAKFNRPRDVDLRSDGGVVVADQINRRVRLVLNGQVSTLAGSGGSGSTDGASTSATFVYPFAVAVGAGGAVFVADTSARRIRRIAGGQVTTVAGSGSSGSGDGPALGASFNEPRGLAVLPNGSLLIADYSGHRLRMLDKGVVSTVAGSGTTAMADGFGKAASLSYPSGVVVGPQGQVYVSVVGHDRIRRVLNPPVWCGDGQPCTKDVCDPKTGTCSNPKIPDGGACTDDSKFCTVDMTCKAGVCQGGKPNPCDDKNACSLDSCDAKAGKCVHSAAPGCKAWHRVFVTSKVYYGSLGGLGGADAECGKLAAAADLDGEWMAWLSTYDTAMKDRYPATSKDDAFRLLDGTVVATSWADLTDGTLQNGIALTEKKTALTASSSSSNSYCGSSKKPKVHTGTNSSGKMWSKTKYYSCNAWTTSSSSSSYRTASGTAGATNAEWTYSCTSDRCYSSYRGHLYCFEVTSAGFSK